MIKKIYKKLKTLPILGRVVIFFRKLTLLPAIQKYWLKYQDKKMTFKILVSHYPQKEVRLYLKEVKNLQIFKNEFHHGHSGDFDVMFLYCLIRLIKPAVVVETGVASGRSSAFILAALEKNNQGRLYSIDLPHYYQGEKPDFYKSKEGHDVLCGYVPQGKEPGWLVPNQLRPRWNLILGDSKIMLPELVSKLDHIDIFYHDSDHSYEYMMFEFENIWPKLIKGGFLLADDIKWNKSFDYFKNKVLFTFTANYRGFGILKKK